MARIKVLGSYLGSLSSSDLVRERVMSIRALAIMVESGVPILGAFEFLAQQCTHHDFKVGFRRISQNLANGFSLDEAADKEPEIFSELDVRMLHIGLRAGKLVAVLNRMADNEEQSWKTRQDLQAKLLYPILMSLIALIIVVLLPPLVFSDLLENIVQVTGEPPAITKAILTFSAVVSSPIFITITVLGLGGLSFALSTGRMKLWTPSTEDFFWSIPISRELMESTISRRFLRSFALSYQVGLPATECIVLGSRSAGFYLADRAAQSMKNSLINGDTLQESFERGGFLPQMALDAIEIGQQSGKVHDTLMSVVKLLESEFEYRVEKFLAVLEPFMLATLGGIVAFFALGCLLPIIKLTETL